MCHIHHNLQVSQGGLCHSAGIVNPSIPAPLTPSYLQWMAALIATPLSAWYVPSGVHTPRMRMLGTKQFPSVVGTSSLLCSCVISLSEFLWHNLSLVGSMSNSNFNIDKGDYSNNIIKYSLITADVVTLLFLVTTPPTMICLWSYKRWYSRKQKGRRIQV